RLSDSEVGESAAGKINTEGKRMFVACADKWLEILELQPAGKKRMATEAFLLGYHPSYMQ
ncbi:MAG: hypothetical protein K2K32_00925, partial [Muribaculaceae bacterium]|nr:hypothetical protein [Muribaculaceae bacterium]